MTVLYFTYVGNNLPCYFFIGNLDIQMSQFCFQTVPGRLELIVLVLIVTASCVPTGFIPGGGVIALKKKVMGGSVICDDDLAFFLNTS